jgi:tRNA A-37 threonylcarbamoyl transferase component Bud32
MDELLAQVQRALGDAFRLESELPAGGMSRVFLATEASLNRRVVVKVLPPNMTSEVSAARFRQETELLARLQHPHILPILTSGAREGLLYYVMPYVAGESLRHRLSDGGAFRVDEAVRILSEVADALAHAHSAGVLHRDIKPENILLEGRHAVLADFGIARALQESGARLTATGAAVGTPGYMSPEQVAGDAIDARADIYALGVVGYEMLAGEPPFRGPTAQAVLTAHLTTPPLPLSELRPEVPLQVSNAIARALSKQPEDRFKTAGEFAEALTARAAEPTRALASPNRRRLLVPALLAVAVIAVLLWGLSRGGGRIEGATFAAIQMAADSARLDEVARLIEGGGIDLSSRALRPLFPRIGGRLGVQSEPSGALVEISRVGPIESFPERPYRSLGRTPIGATPLVAGEYSIRLSSAGHETQLLLANLPLNAEIVVRGTLIPADSVNRGSVLVPAGPSPLGEAVDSFAITRHEITNSDYQAFLAAGGYRNPAFWPAELRSKGRTLPWAQAVGLLVDRSGLPGPRTWEEGRYPAGKEAHPVTGVSWYEASAYARWAGGELPRAAQWWRAALGDSLRAFPWGQDGSTTHRRANLEGVSTAPVGSYPLGVSPFGVLDLAGNVREWLADSVPGSTARTAVGGSWQDPQYMFEASHTERFQPDYASDGLGFRIVRPVRRR